MYHIKNDQRAIRSSRLLYDALVQLMQSQPYDTITVTNLADVANLGRTTFYRNFDEIEDILQMRCDQVFDELLDYVVAFHEEDESQETGRLLKPVLQYFYQHSDIIDLLIKARRIDIMQDSFRERSQGLQEIAAQQRKVPAEYMAYAVEIRINMIISIVTHWVKTGKRQAPDELADTLKAMINDRFRLSQLL